MTFTERRRQYRQFLQGAGCLYPASIFDPVSARLAEAAGFEVGMLAGSIASATVLGAPDIVVLTPDRVRGTGAPHRPGRPAAADGGRGPRLRQCLERHEDRGGVGGGGGFGAYHRGYPSAERLRTGPGRVHIRGGVRREGESGGGGAIGSGPRGSGPDRRAPDPGYGCPGGTRQGMRGGRRRRRLFHRREVTGPGPIHSCHDPPAGGAGLYPPGATRPRVPRRQRCPHRAPGAICRSRSRYARSRRRTRTCATDARPPSSRSRPLPRN